MSLDERFNAAAEKVKKFSKRPPDADMLEIYALYKQSIVGDTNIPKPGDSVAAAKWSAWNGKKGVASSKAKEDYIAKVNALAPKYA